MSELLCDVLEVLMKEEYLEKALVLVRKVFPSAGFDLSQDIVIRHSDGIIYGVRMGRYKNLEYHEISDEQKADIIANEVVKMIAYEILNKDT